MSRLSQPARGAAAVLLLGSLLLPGCDQLQPKEEPRLPTADEVAVYFQNYPDVKGIEIRGNVVEVHVTQDATQLRRGGSLWAKVGPYIYLFSPGTRDLFQSYPGVAAVRVVTFAGKGGEVARALLRRDTLSDILWRRSLNIMGLALQEGTERPVRLEKLVGWGEEYTDYDYSPAFVPR